jgi:hypothetical protein
VPELVDRFSVADFEEASTILTTTGVKTALTPAGNEVALRFTSPVNPASGVIVIWNWAEAPGTAVLEEG